MSLFGPPPAQSAKKHLVSFRAGKMFRDGTTKVVKPDTRKGLIYMDVSDDSLLHFFWKDRKSNKVEEDLIIFPEEAEFERVTCTKKTTDRVYVLRFKSSSQKHFFWMQEPTDDKDKEIVENVNKAINDPSSLNSDGNAIDPEQEQLLRLLQQTATISQPSSHPATSSVATSSSTATASTQPAASDLEKLRSLLAATQVPQSAKDDLDLSAILTINNLKPVLENAKAREALFPHFPPGVPHTREELDSTIRSPQFKQSLQTLSYALRSGSLDTILTQMGVTSGGDAVGNDGVRLFLKAIAAEAKKKKGGEGGSKSVSDGKEDGDAMDTS